MHPDNLKQLRSKTKNLKFGQFGQISRVPGGPNGSLHPKILHRYFYTGNLNTFWKFEASMTADKKNEILTILESSMAPNGEPNQNFGPTTFLGMVRWVYTERLRILAQKLKEKFYFPILGHFGLFGAIIQKQGPKSKFRPNNFFCHKKVSITWEYENPSWKAEGGVLFLDFGPFWARFGP